MWLGAILVVMMIFRPQGLIPSKRRRRELGLASRWHRRASVRVVEGWA